MDESSNSVSFLLELANLSIIERAGWGKRGISNAESVSDHSFSMTMMNLMLKSIGDPAKRARMAMIHDIAETEVGDITPSDGVPKELKQKKENLAMEYYVIEAGYANAEFAKQLKEDWREFDENETFDAHIVHDTDRYDCATRLLWYEKRQGGKWRQDKMFQGEIDQIVTFEVKLWAQKLTEERKAFWASRSSNDLIIFIIGPPGSGKTTQCARLALELDMHHISVGEVLRIESESRNSPYAELIKRHMAKDEISGPIAVPAGLTMKLLRRDMKAAGKKRFIIDGFPRTVLQLLAFNQNISDKYHTILLKGNEEILIQRLEERARSSKRVDDDSSDKRVDRVKGFKHQNLPVEEYLQSHQGLITVDCNGSEDQIYENLKAHVKEGAGKQ